MINKVIKKEEVIENNIVYIIEYFQNGSKVKYMKSSGKFIEVENNIDSTPTESEIYQAEMLLMQAEILEKLNAMEV